MLDSLTKFPDQIQEALNLGKNIRFKDFNRILVCGMGGSGIVGYLLKDLLNIPVHINQDYNIPKFIDKKTLALVISYSGNTEETIEMYKKVRKKTKKILIITSNGKLKKEKNALLIPAGEKPKNALVHLFFPVLKVMKNCKLINYNPNSLIKNVKKVQKDKCKKLARKMINKVPVIYFPNNYYGVALRWKQALNETSKQLAIANSYPEFYHNEILADYDKKFFTIIAEDKPNKKISFFKKLVKVYSFKLEGNSQIDKMVYGLHFGDYLAYYLALLKKKDPDIEKKIDKIKCIRLV